MKFIFFAFIILSAAGARACPNFSGTYQVDFLQNGLLIRVEQHGCQMATLEVLDASGRVYASRTDFYDGKLRPSQWVSGEVSSMNWNGVSLHQYYFLNDDGTITNAEITKIPNGDLEEVDHQIRSGVQTTTQRIWKKQ